MHVLVRLTKFPDGSQSSFDTIPRVAIMVFGRIFVHIIKEAKNGNSITPRVLEVDARVPALSYNQLFK